MSAPPDTIFAPASGHGRAAIAVIRLSGPGAQEAVARLTGGALPPPRRASLRTLCDPRTGEKLDQALVLWMPAPASFTGEDTAELHVHGGAAVRVAVLRTLGELGLRAAQPGEFTRRAFLSGRLDLSAVEGLADLVDAETEAQRRQALRQLEGALGDAVTGWRDRLVDASALLAASLDFTDEPDVAAHVADEALAIINTIMTEVSAELSRRGGERLREGFVVVIAGPPNSGKSTLLNAIARRDVAIVSPIPGTTRDAIEIRCDLGGLPVAFVDTAGLRTTEDVVEQIGIARTRERAAAADLVLWLVPVIPEDAEEFVGPPDAVPVRTKSDLAEGATSTDALSISAATGAGLPALLALVQQGAEAAMVGAGDALVTRERHRVALTELADGLARAGEAHGAGHDELAAEDVRLGIRALGRITGQVDVEEVLDRVFAQFCIGK